MFGEKIQIASIDVSFISVEKIIKRLHEILPYSLDIIALIKPQFETKSRLIPKGGVLKDKNIHIDTLIQVVTQCRHLGVSLHQTTFSPIQGRKGNIEYLFHLQLHFLSSSFGKERRQEQIKEEEEKKMHENIQSTVMAAHDHF